MKTMHTIIACLMAMALVLPACDFLDQEPDDVLTEDMVFNDEKRVQQWLATVYGNVPDSYWDYGRRHGFNPLADEVQVPLNWSNFGWWVTNVQQGNWSVKTDGTADIWKNSYKAIRAAYVFIDKAKALPDKGLSQERVDRMKLECRFLIAFYYEQMLEVYGPVPMVRKAFASDASGEELLMARTPFDEMVNWLDQELLDIANALPARLEEENSEFGRPTKGAALACRARLLLMAASPLFNGNSMFKGIKNPDGTPLFPQSEDENKWKRAADATRLLLNLAETGVYDLYKEYKGGEIDPFMSFQNLFLTTADKNPEIIFAKPSAKDTWEYDKHSQPRGYGGNGAYGVTQELVDAFYTKNGLPIDDDPDYEEEGFSTGDEHYPNTAWAFGNQHGVEGLITPSGTYNMYTKREPRFYITVRYNNQWFPKESRNTAFYNGGVDGPPSYDSPQCGYLVRKRIHPEGIPKNNYTPYRPGIIFRLGEFYLNYVEALNEADPNNPDILKYLNLIRQRAGIPAISSSMLGKQNEMREIIRAERRIELATEGKRYADMRRWLIARSAFSKPITGMNTQGSAAEYYKRTKFMDRVFDDKMYLWPIHQDFIDVNPNLVQNYGW